MVMYGYFSSCDIDGIEAVTLREVRSGPGAYVSRYDRSYRDATLPVRFSGKRISIAVPSLSARALRSLVTIAVMVFKLLLNTTTYWAIT
jgi:hypothetical protein